MHNSRLTYIKNILLPCLLFSGIAGAGTGVLIFLFKLCAGAVIDLSGDLYASVRETPAFLPLLIGGAALLGLAASVILRKIPDCRGGGIPTAIAIVKGLIPFHWVKSIVFVFTSAMLTYLCGVPLGNEGPSVQMGTAVGRGIVRKHPAWNRYIMTGGACAGFAAATGSPLTGILFAFEEAHRHFSPMIFLAASIAVLAASAVMQALCPLAGMDYALFTFADMDALPLCYLWAAVIVGLAVGFSAAAFTRAYCILRNVIRHTLQPVPFTVKVVSIFAVVSLIGFFSADCIGSGHGLVDEMIEGHGVWYSLILFLLIRAFLLLIATNTDVTGGLFVPMLAFGAILGALCGKAMTAIGILPEEHYALMVVIGIASFLSAASRTPLMALAFSIEILNGLPNLLPIGIGISIAFLVIETIGITAFTETVVESKTEAANAGRPVQTVHRTLEVMPGSFAVGKEIRDILWPPRFTIVSVHKNPAGSAFFSGTVLVEGDMLYVHYRTCTPDETLKTLEAVVGPQKPE
ncbi:MAG: hypothetical protein E7579_09060 [Ruminococcaceae bacterium]|nr:hypothetical protein [Oscillospiraceae bacterium]